MRETVFRTLRPAQNSAHHIQSSHLQYIFIFENVVINSIIVKKKQFEVAKTN